MQNNFYCKISCQKEGKGDHGVDNVHTSEMRVHHSEHVFHAMAEKKKKNMSPFSNVQIF